MINLLIGLIFTFSAWSAVDMGLVFKSNTIKQGEIVQATLVVKKSDGQTTFSGLKGKNISKTLYLMNVSPFMMKGGQLEADAKVIFLVVPATNYLIDELNGEKVTLSWESIQIEPTETSKSFLLGDFEIPERLKPLPWLIGILIVILLLLVGRWGYQKWSKKGQQKQVKTKLKQELLACTNYQDVVKLWKQKRSYVKVFPEVENAFKGLEEVLFKYQFKPKQTEFEMQEVLTAYQKFKATVAGVLNGI